MWQIQFPPLPYGGPYTLTLIQENDTYELNDIYIGEVYLLGGQSNMEFKLFESSTLPEKWHSNNMLRLFSPNRIVGRDRYLPEDGWVCAKKEEVGDWSAIGYLTGDLICQKKGIAVGLISCYQGESDCSVAEANVYAKELCQLIDVWRTGFQDPERKGWKLIQKAQLEVPLLRSNVQTVICADICEDYEIHPRTKEKLAERMADIL